MLKTWLSKKNFSVSTVLNVADAKKKLAESSFEIILLDLRLPDESGIAMLKWVKERYQTIIVIMMTGYADIGSAVESIKCGAFDYVAKPLNPEELLKKINNALNQQELGQTRTHKKKEEPVFNFVKGHSEAYKLLYEHVDLVAPTNLSILIRGASGVGKEHIARLIHEKSDRSSGPFVAVDCGVLSKELAASEFFGHIKGAFTGAISNKTGYFQTSDGGTLFLDEIGNLSMDIQIQLLRVLQEKKIKQVGGDKEIPVDVRIIAATNENIELSSSNPSFRLDLYHRVSEFLLYVPSLSECKEDINLYLHHFLDISNEELRKDIIGFAPEALDILTGYSWPGNIRELKNMINRLTLITTGAYIGVGSIPDYIRKEGGRNLEPVSSSIRQSNERERIEDALRISNNNKSKAATLLNIDRKTLYNKLKHYEIDV